MHRRNNQRNRLLLGLLGLLLLIGLAAASVVTRSARTADVFDPGLLGETATGGTIAGGESRRYPLPLTAGRYVRLEVTQHGIDLMLRVLAPEDAQLVESDGWGGAWGPDRVSFIAERPGVYLLELRPGRDDEPPGRFTVRVVEQGIATRRHRLRVAGDWSAALGRVVFMRGRRESYELAAAHFEQAVQSFHAAGDVAGEADARYYLATAERAMERRGEALRGLEHALELARSIRDRRREAEILIMRARASIGFGWQRQALDDLSRALVLWRRLPDATREVMKTLLVLTNVYSELGDRSRTRAYATLTLRHARAMNERYSICQALHAYGLALLSLGEPENAVEPLRESLALSRQLGAREQPLEPYILNSLGMALVLLERDESARETLGRALDLSRREGRSSVKVTALLHLAATYRNPADAARKRALLDEALRVSRESNDIGREAQALEMLGGLELEAGRFETARAFVDSALKIRETMWRLVPSPSLQAAYLADQFEIHDLYVELLIRSLRAGREPRGAELAFAWVEGARARDLQRRLLQGREEIRGGVPADLLERRRALGRELLARQEEARGSETVATTREAESLSAQLRLVESRIAAASPRYAARMLPDPISVKEVQSHLLDDETVLLEYWLGEKRSYLWSVGTSALEVFELPPRDEIEAACREVVEAIAARSVTVKFETPDERRERIRRADSRLPQAARALSRMVLDPVGRAIAGKRVAIVPDGALHHVPWGALPEPTTNAAEGGRRAPYVPLAAAHEIVQLPSAAVLREIRRQASGRPAPPQFLAVLAAPIASHDPRLRGRALADLPYAREEARAILDLVPVARRLEAFDFAASRDLVVGPELARFRIVHFATHAWVDSDDPELSGILLSTKDARGRAQQGFLSLFDIYQLRLPIDLVVLSGCRTALGPQLRGEGVMGLTRGFMFAGAPRMVVSLWDVDDRATAELMKRFYVRLLHGRESPAAALRGAQIEMSSRPRWSAPYYWAGFVLQGDWREPDTPTYRELPSTGGRKSHAGRGGG